MLILPAIDIRGGKCVRLRQGDYAQETIYGEDPVEMAKSFADQGAEWIHLVDLDGAKSGFPDNLEVIRRIAGEVPVKLELGGGIRSLETAQKVLDAGVSRVIFGTRLVADAGSSQALFEALGERAVAGIDARDGKVSVSGWTKDSDVDAIELGKQLASFGAKRFIVTDIATDGMLTGPNSQFLSLFASQVPGHLIASGGVSSLADLQELALIKGVEGAIVGKAIYENRFSVREAIESVGR